MDYSLQGYAEKACIFWGGYIEQPKLIKHRENAVFDVTLRGNVRVALRYLLNVLKGGPHYF